MTHTPLPLSRVIRDKTLAARVDAILATVTPSKYEMHGITIRPLSTPEKIRALVFWGDFPPDDDSLAKRIRKTLNGRGKARFEVSQVGPPHHWGDFRTATVENPYNL